MGRNLAAVKFDLSGIGDVVSKGVKQKSHECCLATAISIAVDKIDSVYKVYFPFRKALFNVKGSKNHKFTPRLILSIV